MKDRSYKRYLLTVLLVILAFNYVDRMALGLLLQDIKLDLALTDTQLGLLTGIAFALFYSVMGIPIARWADRGNRVTIITVTTALWSAAVALCGLAGSFVQLLLIRVGVAVGEAGCIPPAHSLIADHFARSERPRAVAIYMLGSSLSMFVGYFLAGWLNEYYGWRATFFVLGLPGLALAILVRLTLREPRLRHVELSPGVSTVQPGLREVCAVLWRNRTFRYLSLCISVSSFFGSGILQWQPAFFMRSYGFQTGEVGTAFAAIWGIGGLIGTYAGGVLASRYAANNERRQLRVMAVAYCAFGVLSASVYLSATIFSAFVLMGIAAMGITAVTGPLFATVQTLVPGPMRAMSIAVIYLFANLIGMGLGPLAAGALSDFFQPWAGPESLRYALLTLCPGYLVCGWLLLRASDCVGRDVIFQEQAE